MEKNKSQNTNKKGSISYPPFWGVAGLGRHIAFGLRSVKSSSKYSILVDQTYGGIFYSKERLLLTMCEIYGTVILLVKTHKHRLVFLTIEKTC